MVSREQVVELIKDYLQSIRDIERDSVAIDTQLDEFDIDSLDKMEMVFGLESTLQIRIAEGLQKEPPKTVGDVVSLVMRNAIVAESTL